MKVALPEALSILGKWLDDSTLLHCVVELKPLGATVRCRVESASESLITFEAGPFVTLRIPTEQLASIEYGDTRALSEESATEGELKGALLFFFGRSDDPRSELITVLELSESEIDPDA